LNIVQARANDRLRVGIILGVVALTMSQTGAVAANSPEITVYEHSRGQLTTNGIQLADDVVYLPLSLLTQSWG
jgi:purine nucleoside phosphorylase